MHRIDHATAAPGNLFTEGNPATATPATTVTDDWLNDVQGNICEVVETAGLALVKGDYTQLRQAIQAMLIASQKAVIINNATFEASVSNGEVVRWDSGNSRFDEAVADGTSNNRAVGIADVTNSKVYLYGECPLFSGLTPGARYYLNGSTAGAITTTAPTDSVMVGIAKSATTLWVDIDTGAAMVDATESVKGVMQIASNAEAQALSNNTKALTPAKLAAALQGANQSLASAGYQKLPGGLIVQWGTTANISHNTSLAVTLPVTFPNACIDVQLTVAGDIGVTSVGAFSVINSAAQITIYHRADSGASAPYRWLVIGY